MARSHPSPASISPIPFNDKNVLCFPSRPVIFYSSSLFEHKPEYLQIFHYGVSLLKKKFCYCRDKRVFICLYWVLNGVQVMSVFPKKSVKSFNLSFIGCESMNNTLLFGFGSATRNFHSFTMSVYPSIVKVILLVDFKYYHAEFPVFIYLKAQHIHTKYIPKHSITESVSLWRNLALIFDVRSGLFGLMLLSGNSQESIDISCCQSYCGDPTDTWLLWKTFHISILFFFFGIWLNTGNLSPKRQNKLFNYLSLSRNIFLNISS